MVGTDVQNTWSAQFSYNKNLANGRLIYSFSFLFFPFLQRDNAFRPHCLFAWHPLNQFEKISPSNQKIPLFNAGCLCLEVHTLSSPLLTLPARERRHFRSFSFTFIHYPWVPTDKAKRLFWNDCKARQVSENITFYCTRLWDVFFVHSFAKCQYYDHNSVLLSKCGTVKIGGLFMSFAKSSETERKKRQQELLLVWLSTAHIWLTTGFTWVYCADLMD